MLPWGPAHLAGSVDVGDEVVEVDGRAVGEGHEAGDAVWQHKRDRERERERERRERERERGDRETTGYKPLDLDGDSLGASI